MKATLSIPGSEGTGSAWAVGVPHWHKKNKKGGMGRKTVNGKLRFHQQKLIMMVESENIAVV